VEVIIEVATKSDARITIAKVSERVTISSTTLTIEITMEVATEALVTKAYRITTTTELAEI